MNLEKAVKCLTELLAISQKYNNTAWYKEAETLYYKLNIEIESSKSKEDPLNELGDELSLLDSAESLYDEGFLQFVFKNFHPKHKNNVKMPEIGPGKLLKKTFTKVATFYHPDKINVEIHGVKYKVLCEEIVKRVFSRFSKM